MCRSRRADLFSFRFCDGLVASTGNTNAVDSVLQHVVDIPPDTLPAIQNCNRSVNLLQGFRTMANATTRLLARALCLTLICAAVSGTSVVSDVASCSPLAVGMSFLRLKRECLCCRKLCASRSIERGPFLDALLSLS